MRRVDRSDFRLPVVIHTSKIGVLRRPVESALAAAVAVMHQPHAFDRATFVDRLFQCIKDETGVRGGADAPANDPPELAPVSTGHSGITMEA